MGESDFGAARDYHEATKHSERSLRADRHGLDWANQPRPFKIYRGIEANPLPRDFAPLEVPALDALGLSAEPTPDREAVPDLPALARLLYLSAGITKVRRHPGGEVHFRAYPNTGALYHVDLYVVCGELPGLDAGVYHFGPHDFALRRLRSGDLRGIVVEATGAEPRVAAAPIVLVSASTYWRNAWKYRARTYRHCFWDAGTLHANLLAVATAEGWAPRLVLGFADRTLERLLGLDPAREGVLTVVPVGRVSSPVPPAPELPEIHSETEPLSPTEVDYPEIRAAHTASSLDGPEDVREWRARAAGPAAGLGPAAEPAGPISPLRLPDSAMLPRASLQHVIEKRGSTREFDPRRGLTFEELSVVLDRATCPLPGDSLPEGGSLLDLYLIVHSVEGLAPGAYLYRPGLGLELLREGNFRREAGRLGLYQELPADAAVNVYSLTRLESVLGRLGNRGYRAAQLEGGLRGGRMYLAAYAQRFGATGLTFLDDEVTDFFSPHARGKAVLFLAALGRSVRTRRTA